MQVAFISSSFIIILLRGYPDYRLQFESPSLSEKREMADAPGDLKFLTLTLHSDGSFTRHPYDPPLLPASPSPLQPVRTKDVTLNSSHGTSARLFLPTSFTSDSDPHKSNSEDGEANKRQDIHAQDDELEEEEKRKKLPLLLYFHGGGFLSGSPAVPMDHAFMCTLASHSGILIVSVEYRLAPEHRLPCAYEDGVEALQWLCNQAAGMSASSSSVVEPWLTSHADFSRLYVAGDSAGANITHHVVSRAAKLGLGLGQENRYSSVCLRGHILIHPFFSFDEGSCRSPEMLAVTKKIWNACLPVGSDAGKHPFANPMADGEFGAVAAGLPGALVLVASDDGLLEGGVAYAEALESAGKTDVKVFVSQNEGHVFHLHNPNSHNLPAFVSELSDFMHQI